MYTVLSKKSLMIAALLSPVLVHAADPATAGNVTETSSFNPLIFGLVSLILVLLLVILITGNVAQQLIEVYRERMKNERRSAGRKIVPVTGFLLLLPSLKVLAADVADAGAAASVPRYIGGMTEAEFYALLSIIGIELIVLLSLLILIRRLIRLATGKPEAEYRAKAILKKSFLDRFNKSVSVEKEEGVLLDHDYDGIRELDNDLPPWWKYGFYLTILVSVVYMWYYHAGGGPDSYEEYAIEVREGEAAVAAYLEKTAGNVDEHTVTLITDASELASAQTIYQTACAACHAADGGGGIGPNLTDNYWMHGGDIRDIFRSIKYGWQDKGMKSWKDDYSPKQIAALSSYIMNMKGTTPASPKEPQGELHHEEGGDNAEERGNSATVAQDSVSGGL